MAEREHEHEKDQDIAKGATEASTEAGGLAVPGNSGMQDQLGHRDQDAMLKDADSDFPEPGQSPEHTGERLRNSA